MRTDPQHRMPAWTLSAALGAFRFEAKLRTDRDSHA